MAGRKRRNAHAWCRSLTLVQGRVRGLKRRKKNLEDLETLRTDLDHHGTAIMSSLMPRASLSLVDRLGYVFAGHSMGCISAAMAATDSALSPRDVTLVLVAPLLAPRRCKDGEEASEPGGTGDESLSGGDGSVGGIGKVLMRALKVVLCVPSFGLRVVGGATSWVFNRVFLTLIYPGAVVALRWGFAAWTSRGERLDFELRGLAYVEIAVVMARRTPRRVRVGSPGLRGTRGARLIDLAFSEGFFWFPFEFSD